MIKLYMNAFPPIHNLSFGLLQTARSIEKSTQLTALQWFKMVGFRRDKPPEKMKNIYKVYMEIYGVSHSFCCFQMIWNKRKQTFDFSQKFPPIHLIFKDQRWPSKQLSLQTLSHANWDLAVVQWRKRDVNCCILTLTSNVDLYATWHQDLHWVSACFGR